jgi:hypothetical protein
VSYSSDTNNSSQSSNVAPNPGTPESKPVTLNVSNVSPVNNPQSITKTGDNKPNITSTHK